MGWSPPQVLSLSSATNYTDFTKEFVQLVKFVAKFLLSLTSNTEAGDRRKWN